MTKNRDEDVAADERRSEENPLGIETDYDLDDQEVAEDLVGEDVDRGEIYNEDFKVAETTDDLFVPPEVDEEVAEEIADNDIREDGLGEIDIDAAGRAEYLADQEVAENLVGEDIEQGEINKDDFEVAETTADDLFVPPETDEEVAEEITDNDIEENGLDETDIDAAGRTDDDLFKEAKVDQELGEDLAYTDNMFVSSEVDQELAEELTDTNQDEDETIKDDQ